jgi:hypothetical protein
MPRKGENAGAVKGKGKGMFALPDYFNFLTGGTQRKTPKEERRKRAKEAGGDGMAGSPASSHVQSVESPSKSPANRCDCEAELRPACPDAA